MTSAVVGGSEAARLLPYDAVFRIEVSLSSQRTSAIVMRTTARLYSLEGTHSNAITTGDAEWKSVAYGAPCIQLMRDSKELTAPFTIRIVMAEVESGISLWETEITPNSRYAAMQTNFHTFSIAGHTYAIQFASEEEAARMLESMQDLIQQKQKQETVDFERKRREEEEETVVFKKPKPIRRLSKKDISAPCNFKHVSGITMQRTQSCEQELRGTIQRKMRSLSLSSLYRTKPKEGEPPAHKPMVDTEEKGSGKKPPKKFGSLRSSRKKPSKETPDGLSLESPVRRGDPRRMSLPSHFRQKSRPQVSSSTFTQAPLNRALSHSSGDIPNVASVSAHSPPAPQPSAAQPSPSYRLSHTSAPIERRHTMLERSPGHRPVKYTHIAFSPSGSSLPRPSLSDMSLNRTAVEHHGPPRGPVRMVGGPGRQRRVSADHTLQPRPVQHMAIAESDIIGRTPDGRLIVQMPAIGSGSQPRQPPSGQRPLHGSSSSGSLQFSAATLPPGQPHPSQPYSGKPHPQSGQPHPQSGQPQPSQPYFGQPHPKQPHSSSSGPYSGQPHPQSGQPQSNLPQSNQLHPNQPHSSQLHSNQLQSAAAMAPSRMPATRPLPPTPLDIAMPRSQALRRSQAGHKPQIVSMGNGTPHITPTALPSSPPHNSTTTLPSSPPHIPATTLPSTPPHIRATTLPSSPPHIPTTTLPSTPSRVPSSPSRAPHIPATTLPSSPPHTTTHAPPPSPGRTQPMASQSPTSPPLSSQPSQSTLTPHRRGSGDYDMLSPSTAAIMQEVTEQMTRALEQFDSVLPPDGIAHTSL